MRKRWTGRKRRGGNFKKYRQSFAIYLDSPLPCDRYFIAITIAMADCCLLPTGISQRHGYRNIMEREKKGERERERLDHYGNIRGQRLPPSLTPESSRAPFRRSRYRHDEEPAGGLSIITWTHARPNSNEGRFLTIPRQRPTSGRN